MGARCIYREQNAASNLEIWDEDDHRSLWFDDVILQSEIHLHDPAVLPNPVNRAMLAHLMFEPPLQSALLAGCGGGAIARWLNARAPDVRGDAVELSATVARLAREYFDFPPPESNWRLLVGDVREHLVNRDHRYDYILVDLEENQTSPDWLTEESFLHTCHDRLTESGVLTLNLITEHASASSEALLKIRQVFTAGIALLSDPGHDNLLVLAAPSGLPEPPPAAVLEALGRRWGIDFVTLAGRLTRLGPSAG